MKIFVSICFTIVFLMIGCSPQKNEKPAVEKTPIENTNQSKQEKSIILFLGTSLTAAYGLEPEEGYPANIQRKIDSISLPYTCVNGGVSGETTSGLLSRLDWMLQGNISVISIESGANDGMRGTEIATTRDNLKKIIDTCREKYPNAKLLLAGMLVPPNMGPEYTKEFQKIYPDIAKEKNVPLIPFLLEGVGGDPKLNQQDRIHPTVEGQKIVANTVWKYLKPLL